MAWSGTLTFLTGKSNSLVAVLGFRGKQAICGGTRGRERRRFEGTQQRKTPKTKGTSVLCSLLAIWHILWFGVHFHGEQQNYSNSARNANNESRRQIGFGVERRFGMTWKECKHGVAGISKIQDWNVDPPKTVWYWFEKHNSLDLETVPGPTKLTALQSYSHSFTVILYSKLPLSPTPNCQPLKKPNLCVDVTQRHRM